MAQESPARNFLVGLVFLGGLALMGGASFMLRGVPWATAHAITVRFPEIDNLRTGEDILVHGFRVGQVDRIDYDPTAPADQSILVTCRLDREIPFTDRTEFLVKSAGPLGGRFVEIVPKPGREVTHDWSGFSGTSPGDLFEEIRRFVEENRGPIREGKGLLGKVINDSEFSTKVEDAVDEFRRVFHTVNEGLVSGDGLLGRLVRDEELAKSVKVAVEEFGKTFQKLNAEDGPIVQITSDLREQKGIAGLLLSDREAKKNLSGLLQDMRATLADVRSGKGLLGRLLTDEQLAESIALAVRDVQDIVRKTNVGEGTLGQLINNREAWDEFVRLLILAREGIEDLREQAPINTFANVLFAVF